MLWAGVSTLSGCASDDLTPPEPEVETPGSFIAVEGYEEPGKLTLVRMIDRLNFEFETLLFYSIYDVDPATWDEARELAKRPDLPLRQEIDAQPSGAITESPHKVVWFRTLTEAEQGRVK
jgi:hypothetical protein